MSNPFSHWLRKFFQPPIFADDPEKTRVSNALYATIFILFTSNTTIFLVLGNIPDQLQTLSKLTQVGIPLVGVVMMFGTFAMARRGKVYGAAWLLISVTWLLTLISTLPSGGINALGFGALVVILLAAGVLLGMRGVLFFFTLTLLSSVLLAEAEIAQWIPLVDHTLAPLPALIAYTALFSSSISMLYIATSDFQKANQKLNTTLKERLLYEQALRDQELSYRSLIEVAPDGIIIFDRDFRILYANARAHQVLNTGSQTDIGPEILKRIIHIVSQSNAIQKKLQSGLPVKIEEHIVMANDRDAWIEGSLKFIPDGGYQFIFEDISARKFVENGLRKRDEILEVVTIAAEQFLSSVDWRENINFVLERLGSGMNVSHAYLFEHTLSPENIPVTSLRYEWTAPGHVSDLGDPLFQNKPLLEPGFERSYQILSHGEVFLGDRSQFLTEEKEFLGNLGIKAIVDVPVFVERKWWGTLGFDDMVIDRIWQQAEIDALKVAANIISAAIQRQQADADRRASERNYRQTIESIGAVPYMLKYAEDRFEYIGESIFELTGYPADEITQSGWNNLIKETIVLGEAAGIDLREAVRLARTGKIKIWKCDYRIQTASGASRWVLDTAVEMLNDQGISTGSVGIFQDITDRKLIEAQTKQLNIELERRVEERTAQLAATNKELEAFSYSVSHDLRAPLRAMRGFSQIILEDYETILPLDGQNLIKRTIEAANKMSELIDALLAFSRLARIEMNFSKVDLSRLAEAALQELIQNEPERVIDLQIERGVTAYCDERLLSTVLTNLCDNALKYTRKKERALIEFGCKNYRGSCAFYIHDNGVGFDMMYAENIFSAFERLHPQSEFPGHGIGLATVQRIINRHGGRIWTDSQPDQGATFYFTLPEVPARSS